VNVCGDAVVNVKMDGVNVPPLPPSERAIEVEADGTPFGVIV
jgi:hypothetical protein